MRNIIKKKAGRPKGSPGGPKWAKAIDLNTLGNLGSSYSKKGALQIMDQPLTKAQQELWDQINKQVKKKEAAKLFAPASAAFKEAIADEALKEAERWKKPLSKLRRLKDDFEEHMLAQEALQQAAFNKSKAPHNPNRTKNGFTPGHKYSPGRPIGSKRKVTSELEKIGEENALIALENIIHWMKEGNADATKFLLERVYPVRRDLKRHLGYEGKYDTLEDMNDLSRHILTLMGEGEISSDDAYGYGKVIEQRIKNIAETSMAGKYAELKAFVDNIAANRN